MQVSWEVLHGQQRVTGAVPSASSETGIFVGIQQMEYGALASPHLQTIGPFSATGGSFSVAAGRMSYTYGFKGPAVSLKWKHLSKHCQLFKLSEAALVGCNSTLRGHKLWALLRKCATVVLPQMRSLFL